ncbi:MAG: PIG-L family deacetylase [Chloroflexi bacterium]|nr:PIG-L family deacetylase [Chloroflexota bacterium]
MNVLAIGAHGDDLEIFCGGTLARFRKRGDHVFMCVVTDGRGRPIGDLDTVIGIRREESRRSAAVIGAEPIWMGLPDGGLWFDEPTRHRFVEVIRECKPDLIITHPPEDYHPDHKTTSRLVMDAAQIARTVNYPSALPPHRATVPVAFMEAENGIGFVPEEYVDVSDVWTQKLAMLDCHLSQIQPANQPYDPGFPLPAPENNMFHLYAAAIGAFRGLAVDRPVAEGFRFWQAANRMVTYRVLP